MKFVTKWRKSVHLIWCFVLLFSAIMPYDNQTANAEEGGTGNRVVNIAGGFLHSLALKSDGTVEAWGKNDDVTYNETTGKFTPKGETTRAQAAAVLIRTLQTLEWIDAE